jgi:toxin ParE1/3/4
MREIRLTNSAQLDLLDIWLCESVRSTEIADRRIDEITSTYEDFLDFPETGHSRDELSSGYRSFPKGQFVIFYRLISEGIEIIRVVHGARSLDEIFLEINSTPSYN